MDVVIRLSEETAKSLALKFDFIARCQHLTEDERASVKHFADLLRIVRPTPPTKPLLPLTKSQHAVLGFICEYIDQHGYAPTFEEIASHFGYNSLGTVHEHLGHLEHKGYIRKLYNEARGIMLTAVPEDLWKRTPVASTPP